MKTEPKQGGRAVNNYDFKWHSLAKCGARLIALIAVATFSAAAQVNVPTYQYDNGRTGQNTSETILTPSNVTAGVFGKLFALGVDGAVVAQPLYMANLTISGVKHNVVFVATENDSVYAYDADSNTGANATYLWKASLIDTAHGAPTGATAVSGATSCPAAVTPFMGITSTPVIDTTTNTMYVVAFSQEGAALVNRLHALDITTGNEIAPGAGPVVINGTVSGTGDGSSSGQLVFSQLSQFIRPALLLSGGTIYVASAASCEDVGPFHGWVFAYKESNFAQTGVFVSTPNGYDGGFWMSGSGLAADTSGNVYGVTGNGTFDVNNVPATELGDTILKLGANTLSLTDYFTPWNQSTMDGNDDDLGSGGLIVLPTQGGSYPDLLVQAGKLGAIYLVNRDQMTTLNQHYCSTCSGTDTNIVQELPGAIGGMWSSPAYWNGNVYFWGQYDNPKMFSITNGLLSSTPTFTATTTGTFFGQTPAVSSNGTANGVVWFISHSKEAILYAYNATNLTPLYNSDQVPTDIAGTWSKFMGPVISNGKVYVGTTTEVDVYGLLNGVAPTVATPTFSPGTGTITASQQITISDTTSGATIYYTINGSAPTVTASEQYAGPFTLSASATVQAIAAETGYTTSPTASAVYTVAPPAATPTISPNGGTITTTQQITISDTTPGYSIYYTTNGSAPKASASEIYSGPFTLSASATVQAIAVASGFATSSTASASFTVSSTQSSSISFVQGTYSNPTSASPVSATFSLAQTQGDLNVVIIGWYDTTSTISSVTDSKGNVYTLAVGPTQLTGDGTNAIYYAKDIAAAAAGANTVRVTFSQAVPYPDLRIAEYSGADTSNPLDVTAASTGSSAVASSGPLTTTSANDILVAGGYVYAFVNGAGTGFTNRMSTPDGDNLEDELVPAIGTYTATASLTSSAPWIFQCVAFRPPSLSAAATPTISPAAGTISTTQQITISDTTSGYAIYYTTNGAALSVTSTELYSGPFTLPASATVEAMAVATGYSNSAVASASYTVQSSQAATPTFSEGTGTYSGTQSITLNDTTSGATIYYAINATPTTSSTKYTAGAVITVSTSETIEAIAVATGYTQSNVASATYTINPVTNSTITYVQGTYTNPFSGNPATATYTLAQTAGDLNVLIIGWYDTTSTISSVTDTKGNVYTLAVGPTRLAGDGTNAIYYAKNIAGAAAGTNTVTVTFNQTVSYPELRIVEYSGADTSNPLDVTAAGTGNSALASSGPLTTTSTNDILVAGGYVYTFVNGAGSGFTNRMFTPDGDNLEDELVPAIGTYTATASLNASAGWIMQCVAFRPPSL